LLSRFVYPEFPECIGVFRDVEKPTYEDLLNAQIAEVMERKGPGTVEELFKSEDTWVVE